MPDIPNRDELEKEIAKLLGRYNRQELAKLVELMKNHPTLANVPAEFWDKSQRELVKVLMPFSEVVYLEAAGRVLETIPIGVDWGLVNTAAADWARSYSTLLAGQINTTSRRLIADSLRNSIASFFEEGLTVGELEARLLADPDLMQLFTGDVRDRLGRLVYGPNRAATIAVTEVTRANSEGSQMIAGELRKQGIEMIPIWQTNNDAIVRECPICWPRHNKPIEDNVFPPGHVRCRCWPTYELPVLAGP